MIFVPHIDNKFTFNISEISNKELRDVFSNLFSYTKIFVSHIDNKFTFNISETSNNELRDVFSNLFSHQLLSSEGILQPRVRSARRAVTRLLRWTSGYL